jgi:apolipoprotein N-acyltransferase
MIASSYKGSFSAGFKNKVPDKFILKAHNESSKSVYLQKSFFKKAVFIFSLIVTAFIVLNALLGAIYIRKNEGYYEGKELEIVLVQPNVSFDDKFATDTDVLIPEKKGLNNSYFNDSTELVVFPETVVWGSLEQERNNSFYKWVKRTAEEEGLYFIMGQIVWDEKDNYYNTVHLYNPELELLGRYDKIHPLPCAEYMPYPDVLGFLSFLNMAKLNITPAKDFVLLEYPNKGSIGANICFESTLQLISRSYRKMGADILFTFTDTAGFKDSIVAWHHVVFSKVRAIENNSFMVHSGNNGISAVIDPFGKILKKTDIGKKEILYSSVSLNKNKSFFTIYGELLLYIYFGISFIILMIYVIYIIRKKNQEK